MVTTRKKIHRFTFSELSPVLTFRSPPDDDDSSDDGDPEDRPMTSKQFNAAFNKREKGLMKKIEAAVQGSSKSSDDDMEALDAMVDKLVGADVKDLGTPGPAPTQASDQDQDDNSTGLNARLETLERSLAKETKRREEAEKTAGEKDQKMVTQRRNHTLEGLLTKRGAINAKHASSLIFPKILDDEEMGDVVSIKTDSGDEDVIPLEDYVDRFKEENDYMFLDENGKRKTGAGSVGGSSGTNGKGKPGTKIDDLRSPEEGGMSWKEYEERRPEIIKDVEAQVRGK